MRAIEPEDQRLASGLPVLDLAVEEDREKAARLLTAEAMAAIRSAGDVLEWYDKTISKTIGRSRGDRHAQQTGEGGGAGAGAVECGP